MHAEVLEMLSEWECRTDHDIGPGLVVGQCWIKMFCDGSGAVVAELHTCSPVNNVDLSRLLTNLGVEGRLQKAIGFDKPEQIVEILSKPLVIDWQR